MASETQTLYTLSFIAEEFNLVYPLVLQAAQRLKLKPTFKINRLRHFDEKEISRLLEHMGLPEKAFKL